MRIIIPEAIEVAIPSIGNTVIGLVKSTSLAFSCAVVEITAEAKILASRNFRYFEAYISLAIIYWLITIILEQIVRHIEKRARVPDKVPNKTISGAGNDITRRIA
jgi:polar amino acid transport system permease protein